MTFENLPQDWPMRSLSHDRLARDVLDLVVSNKDRLQGGIAVLLCGATGRLKQPVFISDATPGDDLEHGTQVIKVATRTLCARADDVGVDWATDDTETDDPEREYPIRGGSVLFAIARVAGGTTDTDRAWHQRVIDECREAGVRLLGMHLVTLDGVLTMPSLPPAATLRRPDSAA